MTELTLSPLTAHQTAAVTTIRALLETLRPMANEFDLCPWATGPDGDLRLIPAIIDLVDAVESLDEFLATMAPHSEPAPGEPA